MPIATLAAPTAIGVYPRHPATADNEAQTLVTALSKPIRTQPADRILDTVKHAQTIAKKKPDTRRPILSEKTFVDAHLEIDQRLDRYPFRGGANKIEIPKTIADQFQHGAIRELHANNARSRIGFVRASAEIFHPIMLNETRPIHWVTLTNKTHTMEFEAACEFSLKSLQSWTRYVLPRVNFIGMVDMGVYPVPYTSHSRIIASFHSHLLCWGPTPAQMDALGAEINSKYNAFIPNRPVFYARIVSPDWANRLVYYMEKHPLKSARFVSKYEWIEPDTGEVHERGQDRHYEERISSGRAVRVATILQKHRLSDLLFASGEGASIRKDIIGRAIIRLEREWKSLPMQLRR